MSDTETDAASLQTTYCPFKAPSRTVATTTSHHAEFNRFEQRPGMAFVHATLGETKSEPQTWPAKSHLQIAYITSGNLKLSLTDKTALACQPGDWLLLKPSDATLHFEAFEKTDLFWLEFSAEASVSLTGFSDTVSPQILSQSRPHLSRHPTAGRLLSLAEELSNISGQSTRERLLIEAKTLEWLALILDQPIFSPCRAIVPQRTSRDEHAIKTAARILETRFDEDHSIAQLSRDVHLNEFKLKRGFKEQFGTTVFGYLRQKRMERAREYLIAGERSVIEIANAVGYSNPSHFARAFKEAFGHNPSEVTSSA